MFDAIVGEAREKYDLGGKSRALLSALLNLIADPAAGGFTGFVARFKSAGLDRLTDSWIQTGDNAPVSAEQIESALGAETLKTIARQTRTDTGTAASALAFMTPRVIDLLTPDGEIPEDAEWSTKIRDYLDAAPAAEAAPDGLRAEVSGEVLEAEDRSGALLKWLVPLVLLGLLIVVGNTFCGRAAPPAGNSRTINPTNAGR